MSGWEEVTPDEHDTYQQPAPQQPHPQQGTPLNHSPFGGVEAVDGIVYAPQETSPELNWRPTDHDLPALPVRERPAPRHHQRAEPWKPGPDPLPATARTARGRIVKMVALSVIPLALLLGLGYLVWMFMKAYGL